MRVCPLALMLLLVLAAAHTGCRYEHVPVTDPFVTMEPELQPPPSARYPGRQRPAPEAPEPEPAPKDDT